MTTAPGAEAAPFDFSRRLIGANLFFGVPGAVLDVPAEWPVDATREAAWRARVLDACSALGWRVPQLVVRRHAAGASLALSAPVDQLLTATSVNEWAWMDALGLPWMPDLPDDPTDDTETPAPEPITSRAAAFATLADASRHERAPTLMALLDAARHRHLPVVMDDDDLTIGTGTGAHTWPLKALPPPSGVPWPACHAVPTALITGTNGKTTTVRLLAAIAHEAGLASGHSSTAGLAIDGQSVRTGDYSGPDGARAVLRDTRVQMALLETARGGMLRRGLALQHADAAIVTNLSADHFGEYGITDLHGVADAKLIVAHAIGGDGLLVLNADDPVLRERGLRLRVPLAWFAQDDNDLLLAAHRERGHPTCGLRLTSGGARMHLVHPARGIAADLGNVATMPLTLNGHARYNVANLMGAALVASALKLPVAAITATFSRFGAQPTDNPGRLQQWRLPGGITVFVDYAHNPDGLRGLLATATATATAQHATRLILVLGQAGNRADAEIRELATTAASFHPAHVVLKDIAGMQRGRAPGEVAGILRDELQRLGLPAQSISFESLEADAAQAALRRAQPGDTVVLPIHGAQALNDVQQLLGGLQTAGT
jgi:cyanophycin synthetase